MQLQYLQRPDVHHVMNGSRVIGPCHDIVIGRDYLVFPTTLPKTVQGEQSALALVTEADGHGPILSRRVAECILQRRLEHRTVHALHIVCRVRESEVLMFMDAGMSARCASYVRIDSTCLGRVFETVCLDIVNETSGDRGVLGLSRMVHSFETVCIPLR